MSQMKKERATTSSTEAVAETADKLPHAEHKTGDELKAELDSILDEIDEVLETNAEEFVRAYVQKGGQAIRVFLDLWRLPNRTPVRLRFS